MITIDTLTGVEAGGVKPFEPASAIAPLSATPKPAAPMRQEGPKAESARSALSDLTRGVRANPSSKAGGNNAVKAVIVLVVLAMFALLLFATGAWLIVVIALLIPQVREAALPVAKAAFKRIFDQAAQE